MIGYAPSTPTGVVADFFRLGFVGVPIFFALSGFLIAHVSQKTDAIRFGVNRIFRLMPGFWASMTLSFIVLMVLGSPHEVTFKTWAANLFLLPQIAGEPFVDGVYWTLVYEFVFYGWAAVFLFFGIFHRYLLWICAGWLAIATANVFVLQIGAIDRIFIATFAGAFIIGLSLWHIYQHGRSFFAMGLIAASSLHLSFGLRTASLQDYLPNPPEQLSLVFCLIISALIVGIVSLAIFGPQIKRNTDLLVTLGAISYPLYLIHQEIGYAVFRHLAFLDQPVLLALLMTLVSVVLAYAIHEVAETPLRNWLQSKFMPLTARLADRINAINPFGHSLKPL
ncbi:MAG: acyltransferase [Ahrensia sp.]|nr:acyltransferase [Ahrensia sp.]